MAKDYQISFNFIKKHLNDFPPSKEIPKERLEYFQKHLNDGYNRYLKKCQSKHKLAFEEFCREIIHTHNARYSGALQDLKDTYFRQDQYLLKLCNEKITTLLSQENQKHVFNNLKLLDSEAINNLKEIINIYFHHLVVDNEKDILYLLAKRLIDQLISGVLLLSYEKYNDSFIIWRGLLETLAYFIAFTNSGDIAQRKNRFLLRKEETLKQLKMKDASQGELKTINEKLTNIAKKSNLTWWEALRYNWVADLLPNDSKSVTSKSLQEAVDLKSFYPHYQIASIFVHEHLITQSDFKKELSLPQYLLHLYWNVFEEYRQKIIKLKFLCLDEDNEKYLKKKEESMRKVLSKSKEAFKLFSLKIADK